MQLLYAYVISVSLCKYTAFIMVPSGTFYGLNISLLLSCLFQNYAVQRDCAGSVVKL